MVSIVRLEGDYLAFGPALGPLGQPSGARAYRSETGRDWTDLGIVIPEAQLAGVVPVGDRLLAVGGWREGLSPQARFGSWPTTPAVWTSEDGVVWQRYDLPFQGEAGIEYWASALAGAASDAVVVFGLGYPNLESIVEEALPAQVRDVLGKGFGMSWGGSPLSVQVQGPFNLTIFSATFEELGIDPDLADFMGSGPAMTVWRSEDLQSWHASEESLGAEAWVSQVLVGPGEE
ncbi:MAG: hypothetical protein ACRDVL_04890, partial [Acidimicrobiia bacterium]